MSEELNMENAWERHRRERKKTLEILLYVLIGLVISVGSFVLFHFLKRFVIVTVLICVVDVVYAYIHARIFFKSKDWHGIRHIFIPLMMIIYWGIVFAVICGFNAMALEGAFSRAFLLYPIFLMPSFVLEIILVGLICSGI